MSENYDIVVIGGGPGGYVCAIRAAQLGLKVACVEKRGALGGTCLNVGCIPSKALLHSSHLFEEANQHFDTHGIEINTPKVNLEKMMARKDKVVDSNVKGIEFLFKKNKVTYVKGAGEIVSATEVKVALLDGGEETLSTKNIVIATGSEVTPLPGVEIDEKQIVSSTGALELSSVPKKLVVIGAGVIGLELGSVWRRLGSEVTVIEYLDRILPGMDGELAKQTQRIFAKQGLEFKLGHKVTGAKTGKGGVKLSVEPSKGGDAEEIKADAVLVAIGRRPYVTGLGLDNAGVELDERGRVKTDEHFQTNVQGIFAIGDAIAGPMLAHKAEEDGVALAEMLAGEEGHVDYGKVPGVVYTWPEVASVGKTEEQLKDEGTDYSVGKFPFTANGRAKAMESTEGFVKILEDKKTHRVVGCHIVGPAAGDLIAEVVLAMEYGASAEDIARTCHAHPALGESVKEAALAADGRAIHM
ncbi:dihydrolipoyl dehydrogenase [Thalassospira marina]|uniref:Dihydrolipoyl dehydrogenase n=1 Tax=Thalassospira marina TaxID=2048283 RepID=A0A2N3KJ07_9PROT|nr:dihydrolipoyl dehydrogenase [Thalassospira marina]AUG51545.1 dihydrolipoyl dehydrogenase [Thalassospira marina]PKR50525.1 dihydrolipoyl dehydrogenase [Thalassospira marina]